MIEPPEEPHDLDPLMREAIAWVVRLRSGEATQADLDDIRRWRQRSGDHEQAFRQAALLWRDLKGAAEGIAQQQSGRAAALGPFHSGQWSLTRRALVGGAVAASAAAYFAYDPPLNLWPSLSELAADYRTGKGERRQLALGDDVAVTLNTLTSVSVLSSERNEPRIELIAGELAVTARRVGGQPIVVQALGARAVASLATFNARCLDGTVSVTCSDGQVDVEFERSVAQLRAGQQVDYAPGSGLGAAAPIDIAAATAWQQGLLVVRNRPLAEVVDEVNRYRPGRIVVTNAALGRRLVNGTFHIDRLENFPSQVRELFGAGMRVLPGGVVLLS